MTELKQFKLPDVGEGLTEADIVKWHVRPGDKVDGEPDHRRDRDGEGDGGAALPVRGGGGGLLVGEGETVDVGTPIISVDVSGDAGQMTAAPDRIPNGCRRPRRPPSVRAGSGPASDRRRGSCASRRPRKAAVEPGVHGSPAPKQERQPVLVGYGVKLGTTSAQAAKARRGRVGQPCDVRPPAPLPARGRPPKPRRRPQMPPRRPQMPRRQPRMRRCPRGWPAPARLAGPPGSQCSPSLRCGSWPGNSGSNWPPSRVRAKRVHYPRRRAGGAEPPMAAGRPDRRRGARGASGAARAATEGTARARSGSPSAACASTRQRRSRRARSPLRTSPNSCRST